jgi:Protein of unknown function (DUF3237)
MSLSLSDLPQSLTSVQTRPLFVLREQVPPLLVVGPTPNGFRRIGLVQGGSFEGERLSGVVVSGNDWQTLRDDSCMKLDVRLLLRTTDEALIAMTYTVLRAGPPDVMEAMDKGEAPTRPRITSA